MKFKKEQPVFFKPEKKKAIVKEFVDGLIRITYFNKEDIRVVADVKPDELAYYKQKQKDKTNYFYRLVRKFHQAFNHPAPNKPVALTQKQMLNRASWNLEEMIEGLHATAVDKKEFADLYDKLVVNGYQTFLKLANKERPENTLAAQVDAFTDATYFCQGGFVEMGIEPERSFELVHKANMNKLWDDGKPRYNEHGKVIKPDNWVAPDRAIGKEVERQINKRSIK